MPRVIITWEWEEAFNKFGFGDGDSWNGTHEVEGEIKSLGYECVTDSWGVHNWMILDIKKDGKSILFPEDIAFSGTTQPFIGWKEHGFMMTTRKLHRVISNKYDRLNLQITFKEPIEELYKLYKEDKLIRKP